jgi:D-tagatose-1,6-bisphosphate aldolase subunit GatZ/KbaZ
MDNLSKVIKKIIKLRLEGKAQMTLLAVCPNSDAVLEAAVLTASRTHAPMLFAATLNQVDADGGYTGWTAAEFVTRMQSYAQKYHWEGPLYPCLDHGGPWLKDVDTQNQLSLAETMGNVKRSLEACLSAGYSLLHIDPTVDRSLPPGDVLKVEQVVERTVELIAHAEQFRRAQDMPPVAYEVGTEEVHGGLVDEGRFSFFLERLRRELSAAGMEDIFPCFVVAQVGTDLHTTFFDPAAARRLYEHLSPLGALAKGHYTDWVENPAEYPIAGMGGANVGPEFTAAEYNALLSLEQREKSLQRGRQGLETSYFMQALEAAVVASGRWKKWLQPGEKGKEFSVLSPQRRLWLAQTGARYIWTQSEVVSARAQLYYNLSGTIPDPHGYVLEQISAVMDRYIHAFGLVGALDLI